MKTPLLILIFCLMLSGAAAAQTIDSVRVVRVLDYRTLVVNSGDSTSRNPMGDTITLIGIGARDSASVTTTDLEAYLAIQVGGVKVGLMADRTIDRDAAGRKLRYVILEGRNLNRSLIEDGYAAVTGEYAFAEHDSFKLAEDQARINYGEWTADDMVAGDLQP